MSAPILPLPRETVDRIAAGEVVERPASVLKELLENALDAGAARLELEISGGGIELLRLADDGAGIPREELSLALRRHATSKIRDLGDIEGVASFGFRGEALAAIASVSRLTLLSRSEDQDSAWRLEEGGEPRPMARSRGTTVTVRDLFGRVPVRRKFLKGERAEKGRLLRLWEQYVLSHPECEFILVEDGKERSRFAPAAELRERVADLLGQGLARHMVPLSGEAEGMRLSGLCSLPLVSRGNRGLQFLFLGRRPIQDEGVRHAIGRAYREILPPGRFPIALLFLEMDGDLVDVNVHPTKREVRFRNPRELGHLVQSSLARALAGGGLGKRLAEKPEMLLGPERVSERPAQPGLDLRENLPPLRLGPATSSGEAPAAPASAPATAEYWQLDNTFIVTRIGEGLVIVDQHNAHERVLFDRATAALEGASPARQSLLVPHALELSASEMEAWRGHADFFLTLGYELEEFGPGTLAVKAVPEGLGRWDEGEALRDILADLQEEGGGRGEKRRRALATYACKSAIKAGTPLREREMAELLEQLFETRSPYTCPHGRPIIIRIGRDELEKRFHRRVPEDDS